MKIYYKITILIMTFYFISCNINTSEKNSKKQEHENLNNQLKPKVNIKQNLVLSTNKASEAFGNANLGNTCFANTVHKLLWGYIGQDFKHTSTNLDNHVQNIFFNYIDTMNDKLHKLTNSSDNQHSITQTDPPYYQNILNNLFDAISKNLLDNGENGTIDGAKLKKDQGDAASYLAILTNLVDLTLNLNSFKQASQTTLKTGAVMPIEFVKDNNGNDKKFIYNNLIAGKNKTTDIFANLLLENMMDEIPSFNPDGTIDPNIKPDIIKFYFVIDNLLLPPKRILFVINKLISNLNSMQVKVSYPETVSLTFHNSDLSKFVVKKYQLTGAAIYHGNTYAGHYFAYLKTLNTWYKHNDSHVSPVLQESELQAMKLDVENHSRIYLFELLPP